MSGEWRRLGDIIRGPSARAAGVNRDDELSTLPVWAYQIVSPDGTLFYCVRNHIGRTSVRILGVGHNVHHYVTFDASGRHIGTSPNLSNDRLMTLLEAGEHLEYDRGEFL